ncbi:structural protein [Salmonella enterica]|uniref:Structural protein n=1 Tax=Salmonella enterica TaxID=28901 RepID=A0A754AYA4_SALER|nr:structural protein [Salmonella enterica]EBW6383656.1 structural protein [Salmonella enterica subsp. enterica serovar Stanley]ECU9159110.1 structural protein [Salmonella enterica subsp. enterica serovar Newport str. CFSAN000599]EDR3235515.1 structural protein [Salmonella enterica subsp. diarizonae]EDU1193155.1 structural protein [Salmonella enterica subsp. enterica serovar Heidelberg str. CFSAN000576]EBE4781883.1 structural protein [Salmonella enterica]
MNTPRGIRNNNPGNIRWGDDWKGLTPKSQRTDKDFCQFIKPEYGIRAMIVILRNYQRKHGLNTISGIINRWAPTNENNTQAYIDSVAKSTGATPDQFIRTDDSRFMMKLLQAIIRHENGVQPYGFDVFVRAVELAGG